MLIVEQYEQYGFLPLIGIATALGLGTLLGWKLKRSPEVSLAKMIEECIDELVDQGYDIKTAQQICLQRYQIATPKETPLSKYIGIASIIAGLGVAFYFYQKAKE